MLLLGSNYIRDGRSHDWECSTLSSRRVYTWDQKFIRKGTTCSATHQCRDRPAEFQQVGRSNATKTTPNHCGYFVTDSLRDRKPMQSILHVGRNRNIGLFRDKPNETGGREKICSRPTVQRVDWRWHAVRLCRGWPMLVWLMKLTRVPRL